MITQQDVLEVGRVADKLGAVSGPAFRQKYGAGMYYSWVWWQVQAQLAASNDWWFRHMSRLEQGDLFTPPVSEASLGWICTWGSGPREKRLRIARNWQHWLVSMEEECSTSKN